MEKALSIAHYYGKLILLSVFSFHLSVSYARTLTMVSDGRDFPDSLLHALHTFDTIRLDGSKGDFILSHTVVCKHLQHKAIIGTNGACLRTQFHLTDAIKTALDSIGIREMSTAGEGGILSNGAKVREEREWRTRQYLIDLFDDPQESFRSAGCIQLSYCRDIVIQGLRFQGPGSVDVGGNDLLGMDHSTLVRVDSCDLRDGLDGNMDITFLSDSIRVSRCTFGYTDLSYDHMNSNLIGAGDRFESDRGLLHVRYEDCTWLDGCRQRMPMARFGTVELIRCRWLCHTPYPAVDARRESSITIEDGYFGEGVEIPYRVDPSASCKIINNVE